MTMTLGSGNLLFEPVDGWEKLPDGWSFVDVAGVATDSKDNVYVFNRGGHPVIVLDQKGNFLRSWGEGFFSTRAHGIHIGPDDEVYCVDDSQHAVHKFDPQGKLLMTLGTVNKPAPRYGGEPFNRPTHMAVSRKTGDIYVSDGYGNCRIHRYSPDGRHILSWGEPGIDAGQFVRPHNVVIDNDDYIYIADRENHRIQVFDSNGKFQTMWSNIYRPDGICLDSDGNFYVAELNAFSGIEPECPGLGHRVSIYNLQGQLQTRLGAPDEGERADQFIAPHAAAVDSRGDLYVGDVAYTIRGQHMDPPKHLRSFRKFARKR